MAAMTVAQQTTNAVEMVEIFNDMNDDQRSSLKVILSQFDDLPKEWSTDDFGGFITVEKDKQITRQQDLLALIATDTSKMNEAFLDMIGVNSEEFYNLFDWVEISMNLMVHPQHALIIGAFKSKIHWHILGFEKVDPDSVTLDFLKENEDAFEWISLGISILENRQLNEWDALFPGFKKYFYDKIRNNRIDPTVLLMFVEFSLPEFIEFMAEFHDKIIVSAKYGFTEQAHLIINEDGSISDMGRDMLRLFNQSAASVIQKEICDKYELTLEKVEQCIKSGINIDLTSMACTVILGDEFVNEFIKEIDPRTLVFFQPLKDETFKSHYELSEILLSESLKGTSMLNQSKAEGLSCMEAYTKYPDLQERWIYFDLTNQEDNVDLSLYEFIETFFKSQYKDKGVNKILWPQFIRDSLQRETVEDGFINSILFLVSCKYRKINNLPALTDVQVDYEF